MHKIKKTLIFAALIACVFTGCNGTGGSGGENGTGTAEKTYESADRGNTVGNIVNYGSAAEYIRDDGSKKVFEGLYCQYGEKGEQFAKVTPEGEITILKETQPYFINVRDDKVYYADGKDDFRLYTMDIDGSNDRPMTDISTYYVSLWGDHIYFSDPKNDYHLCRMPINGGDYEVISDNNCQYLNVDENYVYFTNFSQGGTIYRCGHDGSDPVMMNREQSMYLNLYENYIYYSAWDMTGKNENDKRLTRLDLRTGATETLNDCQSGDVNIYNNKVYYTDWDNNTIRRMDPDGGNDELYNENYGTYINIAGGKMFCIHYADDTKEISLGISNLEREDEQNGNN